MVAPHCGYSGLALQWPTVKLSAERDGKRKRWSIETSGAVDRALAGVIVLLCLLLAHLLGLDGAAQQLISSAF